MRLEQIFQLSLCSATFALSVGGCGSNVYRQAKVTGRVMCGEKPAWGGVSMFTPLDVPEKTGRPHGNPGNVSLGQVEQDGTFSLRYEPSGDERAAVGVLVGPHRVSFIPPAAEKRKWSSQDDWLLERAQLKQQLAAEPVYPRLECGILLTPSEVDVKDGKNEFDFTLSALKSKGKPTMQVKKSGSD